MHRFNLFLSLVFLLLTVPRALAQGSACKKSEVLAQYKLSLSTLKNQTDQMERYVTGQDVEGFSFSLVFGPSFDFENTESKIKEIRNTIKNNAGVPSENIALVNCLEALKKNDQKVIYEKAFTLFQQTKITLLEKNLELEDNI